MARKILTDGMAGSTFRTYINDNFEEVYNNIGNIAQYEMKK